MRSLKPKNTKISIIGSGGHSRAVIGLLIDFELSIEGFYDVKIIPNEEILGIKGGDLNILPINTAIILAIGDNKKREEYYNSYSKRIYQSTIIHESAYVHDSVTLKGSSLIFPGVHINTLCKIGKNNIINSKCIIEHESIIKDHCHISIGSIISGRVEIGNNCFIGAGAVIKDNIKICDNVTIGAGSVVVKNIDSPGIYAGNPIKRLK